MRHFLRNFGFLLVFVAALILVSPRSIVAQRDYFTEQEIELIRDAQEIDKRIDILTHAIDRRFAVLKIEVSGVKSGKKDSESWGPEPTGTRGELLLDIKRILQKAIDDIDTLAERPDSAILPEPDDKSKKPKGFKDLFPKAVHNLAAAAKRYQPALKKELDSVKDNTERGSILDSLDSCEQIIAAADKPLPADTKKKGTDR